jgi:hypothetical protein
MVCGGNPKGATNEGVGKGAGGMEGTGSGEGGTADEGVALAVEEIGVIGVSDARLLFSVGN